jgi:hemin uptake protein HemP
MDKPPERPPQLQAPTDGAGGPEPAVRRVPASDLMAGQRELLIVHAGREYRLRLTSKGRLILTA